MPTQEAQREYQRRWLQERRQRGIELLGGKCAWCDSTENLEIDHIIPCAWLGYKSPAGGMWSWAWSRIEKELLTRCWVLCKECHRVKSRDDLPETLHSTSGMYHYKHCRCIVCREWMKLSKRDYRARKRDVAEW